MMSASAPRSNDPGQGTDSGSKAELRRMLEGHMLAQAISAAARLGVPDLLKDGPEASDALARKTETHPASLYRLLRLLVAAGLLVEIRQRRFALTPMGALLRSDGPNSLHSTAAFISTEGHWRRWGNLLHHVRTGEPARHAVWDTWEEHPEEAALFNGYMTEMAAIRAAAVLGGYDFTGIARLVDVGGGHGQLLASILKAHPEMRGTLFDLPHVIDGAKPLLDTVGVADRCECVAGSFFERVPEAADAYLLSVVIHDWDDKQAQTILKTCRAAMARSGRLLLVEHIIPTDGEQSLSVLLLDLRMLVGTKGGRERTAEEFDALLSAAGFRLRRIVPLESSFNVIEGAPV